MQRQSEKNPKTWIAIEAGNDFKEEKEPYKQKYQFKYKDTSSELDFWEYKDGRFQLSFNGMPAEAVNEIKQKIDHFQQFANSKISVDINTSSPALYLIQCESDNKAFLKEFLDIINKNLPLDNLKQDLLPLMGLQLELQPGEAYMSSPIIPGDKGYNLWEGEKDGVPTTTSPAELKNLTKDSTRVGLGATERIKEEIIVDKDEFTKIGSEGHVEPMKEDEGIVFAHVSSFPPDSSDKISSGKIAYASGRRDMSRKLQAIAQDYTSSLTARLSATFDILKLRAPNHCLDHTPNLVQAVKSEAHFYFLHMSTEEKNKKYTHDFLEKHSGDAHELGFIKETRGGQPCYIKNLGLDLDDKSEIREIVLRPGDKLYIHKDPLQMKVIIQHADDEIYELGGAAGSHMHAQGNLELNGEKINVGGHVVSFTGLRAENVEVMKVTRTLVDDNGQVREAYGRDTTGVDIARKALDMGREDPMTDKAKSIASTVAPGEFSSGKYTLWNSDIRKKEQRGAATEKLASKTKEQIKNKDEFIKGEEFQNALSTRKKK